MEISQNPLEFLTAKVQETVADTQNLANEIAAKVEESATVLTGWVQSAPSSMVSAGAIATQEAFKIAHNIRFENLPRNLQSKFARAGMRDGMRNVQEAAKVFESIPAQIRAKGPEAIRNFCQDKDWSHIQAHVNGGGSEAANGIFEYFWVNRARGGVDMTAAELAVAKQVLADASADAAALSEAAAELAETNAESAANFKGSWSSLTGALNKPAMVLHNGAYWVLLNNLANVTTSEPSVTADWAFSSGTRWRAPYTASGTLAANSQNTIIATSAPADMSLPTFATNDFVVLNNSPASTQTVRLMNSAYTIRGDAGSISSGTNIILYAGEVIHLKAVSASILEVV